MIEKKLVSSSNDYVYSEAMDVIYVYLARLIIILDTFDEKIGDLYIFNSQLELPTNTKNHSEINLKLIEFVF